MCGFCPCALRPSESALKSESKTKHISLTLLSLFRLHSWAALNTGNDFTVDWFSQSGWGLKPRQLFLFPQVRVSVLEGFLVLILFSIDT